MFNQKSPLSSLFDFLFAKSSPVVFHGYIIYIPSIFTYSHVDISLFSNESIIHIAWQYLNLVMEGRHDTGQIWMLKPSFLTSLWRNSSKATQERIFATGLVRTAMEVPWKSYKIWRCQEKQGSPSKSMSLLEHGNIGIQKQRCFLRTCQNVSARNFQVALNGRSLWQCSWHSAHTWRPLCSCPHANTCGYVL